MCSRTDVTAGMKPIEVESCGIAAPVSTYYGENIFKEATMRAMISEKTFTAFKKWQEHGEVISIAQANEIANAMKEWAISKGATAYTHWFQPMTGLTAEKHDSFITINAPGQVIEKFTGGKLIQGEPDASSFPSGGLRSTFEARGYTAWDPSSPALIVEGALGNTLCIPCIFISYTGEALDKKLPLLRSDEAINSAALELLKVFGNTSAKRVFSTCGPEQEYFLIDEGYYKLRYDLQLTGRTLLGAPSPKGQQLEDQYFGSIQDRILNYMQDVEEECYKLGIPVTTRHNEVAPHQYEFAPIYENSNIAADHNQLLMDIMKKVAIRHGLACVLHEKPFAGINGSGKHLNWSMADDAGNNLLNPGDTPEENLQFLTVLVAIIHAVYHHADLLRASVATAGNEHRLGANEAPPAIVSVFLGESLIKIIDNIKLGKVTKASKIPVVDLGVNHLPQFSRDTTDRNRTSPFAFTGQKFEFRALGSSLNISTPIAVVNTIIADSLTVVTSKIKKALKGSDLQKAIFSTLTEVVNECYPILFEGDNYSEAWRKEAEKRGLPNLASSPEALKAFVKEKNISLFEKHKVFSKSELKSRYHIWIDIYNKVLDIEGKTMVDIVNTQILPSAYTYQTEVGASLEMLQALTAEDGMGVNKAALDDRREQFAILSNDIYYIRKNTSVLKDILKKGAAMEEEERAHFFFEELKTQLAHIRKHVDDLEAQMPDEFWNLPKYREMLFIC
jgi:glutamine synthetase